MFVAAIILGVIFFVTGHIVLGIVAMLGSLPFALATLGEVVRPRDVNGQRAQRATSARTSAA